jgi:hypothetical protein
MKEGSSERRTGPHKGQQRKGKERKDEEEKNETKTKRNDRLKGVNT